MEFEHCMDLASVSCLFCSESPLKLDEQSASKRKLIYTVKIYLKLNDGQEDFFRYKFKITHQH